MTSSRSTYEAASPAERAVIDARIAHLDALLGRPYSPVTEAEAVLAGADRNP